MTVSLDLPNPPSKSKIKLTPEGSGRYTILIPREGLSAKGFFTLFFIGLWMVMILIWSILLIQFGWVYLLISLPFWALSFVAIFLSGRTVFSSQMLEINKNELLLFKTVSDKTSHASFDIPRIESISLVQGTFRTLQGITRRGIYPAIIYKGEAFGFGERCSADEKRWLVELLQKIITAKTDTPS